MNELPSVFIETRNLQENGTITKFKPYYPDGYQSDNQPGAKCGYCRSFRFREVDLAWYSCWFRPSDAGRSFFVRTSITSNVGRRAGRTAGRKRLVLFFSHFSYFLQLTALENVTLPAELAGLKDARAKGLALLEQVGLAERADFFPAQLSGGEQQRVAIARAFITKPEILFADEPSANLDANTGEMVENLLFDLNQQQGTTLVLVTHKASLAERCQAQWVMQSGRLTLSTDSGAKHAL